MGARAVKADDINPSIEAEIRRRIIERVAAALDTNIAAFIRRVDGGTMPSDVATLQRFGHRVQMKDAEGTQWAEFFIWRKHDVLAWRYGRPGEEAAVIFCHLYPDDWPEPLAKFIADL